MPRKQVSYVRFGRIVYTLLHRYTLRTLIAAGCNDEELECAIESFSIQKTQANAALTNP